MFTNIRLLLREQIFKTNILSIFINPFYFIRRDLYNNIKLLSPFLSGRMIDFGCGRKPYKSLFSNVKEYIGVDIKVSGHEHLEGGRLQVDVFYDGKTIPFANEYFDSMLCSEVFEHIFNLDEILLEINRVLKKDALALITVPFVWDEHEAPYDFGRYTSFGIKYLLSKNGFEIVTLKKSGHFTVVVWQLWILYCYYLIQSKRKIITYILYIFLISPLVVLGIFITLLLPKIDTLYHNNVLIAKKIRSIN